MLNSLRSVSIIAVMSLWSRPSLAQSAEDWTDEIDGYDCEGPCSGPRTLGGHTYIPSTLVEYPFILTRVASTTSVGVAELELGPQSLAERLGIDATDDFIYADQSVLASVALAPWISLAIRGQGTAVIPTSRTGGVLLGGNGMYGGNAIAAIRLFRSDRFQATVIGDVGEMYPNSLVPARLPRSPFQDGTVTTIRPSFAIAYSFTPSVGLQASGSYSWRWIDITEDDLVRTIAGAAALTFEMRSVPLTFLVAGQYSYEFDQGELMPVERAMFGADGSRVWGEGAVVYRGRRELDLGAAVDWKLDDIGDDLRWFGQLRLAYYFL
jgi:hypothetical protein